MKCVCHKNSHFLKHLKRINGLQKFDATEMKQKHREWKGPNKVTTQENNGFICNMGFAMATVEGQWSTRLRSSDFMCVTTAHRYSYGSRYIVSPSWKVECLLLAMKLIIWSLQPAPSALTLHYSPSSWFRFEFDHSIIECNCKMWRWKKVPSGKCESCRRCEIFHLLPSS